MKRCFEIQGCPASLYLICPAYKEKKSCWEILGVPCCKRNNKDRCLSVFSLSQCPEGGDLKK